MYGALLQAGYVSGWDGIMSRGRISPLSTAGWNLEDASMRRRLRGEIGAGWQLGAWAVACWWEVVESGRHSCRTQSCGPAVPVVVVRWCGGAVVWCLVDSSAHRLGTRRRGCLPSRGSTRARVRMWKAGREGISFGGMVPSCSSMTPSSPSTFPASFNATQTNLRLPDHAGRLAKMGRGEIDPSRPVAL